MTEIEGINDIVLEDSDENVLSADVVSDVADRPRGVNVTAEPEPTRAGQPVDVTEAPLHTATNQNESKNWTNVVNDKNSCTDLEAASVMDHSISMQVGQPRNPPVNQASLSDRASLGDQLWPPTAESPSQPTRATRKPTWLADLYARSSAQVILVISAK